MKVNIPKDDGDRPRAVTVLVKDISETMSMQNILKHTTEQLGLLKLQIELLQDKLRLQGQTPETTPKNDTYQPMQMTGLTPVQLQQLKDLAEMAKRLS
jgi:hypothetical protein